MTYYSPGIQLENIPFATRTVVALERITYHGSQAFRKNFLGAFLQFQKAYRLWFRRAKSIKRIRSRELGLAGPLSFRQSLRQTYRPACLPSVVGRGL